MKRLTLSLAVCASGLTALAVTPVQAQEYEITVTGTTSGSTADFNDVFGINGTIASGTPFVAMYLVDPTTPTTLTPGEVTFRSNIVSGSLAIGGNAPVSFTSVAGSSNFVDDNNSSFTKYEVNVSNGTTFLDSTTTTFGTAPNPFTLPLNPFTLGSYSITDNSGNYQYAATDGTIGSGLTESTLTISRVSAVPLPPSIWMAVAGLGMLGFALRQRRRGPITSFGAFS
jgi:PEP-CTERM motif